MFDMPTLRWEGEMMRCNETPRRWEAERAMATVSHSLSSHVAHLVKPPFVESRLLYSCPFSRTLSADSVVQYISIAW